MNIKNLFSIAAVAAVTVLASCSNKSMDVAKELGNSYTHDGKTISLEGKLSTGTMVWASDNRKTLDMSMRCGTALDNTKWETVSDVIVNYGTGPNSVLIDVPAEAKEFKDTDIALYDKNGAKLAVTDEVKITGLVTYTAKGPKKESKGFKVNMPKINKEEKEEDGNDYTYKITNVIIEKL